MNKQILLILVIFFNTIILHAQPQLNFTRYTAKQGLPNNDVLSICQDKYGFMWFGSKGGCSRFDGMEFKNYHFSEDDPNSISRGWATNITKDKKGRLWFTFTGTAKTLMMYNYEEDNFIDYTDKIKHHFSKQNDILSLWCIGTDSNGRIWTQPSTANPICFNPETEMVDTSINKAIISKIYGTRYIFEDKDKNLWFAGSPTLYSYNRKDNKLYTYRSDFENSESTTSNSTTCVFQDSDGNIWVGSYNGLHKLTKPVSDSTSFISFFHDPNDKNTLSSNLVYSLSEDKDRNIVIATVNGLCLFNKKENKFVSFFEDKLDNLSISSNLVRIVYRDKDNNIWAGTNFGVNMMKKKIFKTYTHSKYKEGLAHNKVEYLCETDNSNLLLATPKGINLFNPLTSQFKLMLSVTSKPNGLYGAPIDISPLKNGDLWIGTWNGGLSYYDSSHKKVVNYLNKDKAKDIKRVYSLYVDKEEKLWICSSGQGLKVLDKQLQPIKEFKSIRSDTNTLSDNRVRSILQDSKKRFWFGTVLGLNLLKDYNSGIFKRYLVNEIIYNIIEGSDSCIWLATNTGIYKLEPNSGKMKKLPPKEGLTGSVFNILEDKEQKLWVNTSNNLARYEISGDSIKDFTVIRQEEGLLEGGFAPNSGVVLSNGMIALGGNKGLCLFDPLKVKNDSTPPKVVASKLKVDGKTVKIGQVVNKQIILNKSITLTKQLTLNYKNNDFAIEFAGLQYNMPQYNKYAYILRGYDKDTDAWHHTNAINREAKYMNLASGDYTLMVKAANSNGVWSSDIYTLQITILPPWWATWWFTVIWLIIILLVFLLIVRLRTLQLRQQKRHLEKEVEIRTKQLKEMNVILLERQEELEQQAHELKAINSSLENKTVEVEKMAKQLHESDESKLRLFANISHEFRTPLSLIIAPVEKLLSKKAPSDLANLNTITNLKLIFKNAKRLQRLINQIIDFRKVNQKVKPLKISQNNIIEFTNGVIEAFSLMADAKEIELKMSEELRVKNEEQPNQNSSLITHHSSLITDFWFDPDVLEKILYNLISNAIKYTPKGGEILIGIGIVETHGRASLQPNNQLAIKISDTGIGMKPDDLDKIFNRFYRVETHGRASLHENQTDGTGIGLAFTKELVELHKGEIKVESKLGEGTTFTLVFPLGKEHYNIKEIANGKTPSNFNYINSMIEVEETDHKEDAIPDQKSNKNISPNKPTILLIEDNTDLQAFIKSELESIYNIMLANNGEEGWQIALSEMPDLIISDVMMPIMDGITLCNKIKNDENTSHIPVFLLTAKSGEDDIIEGLETGADDYISKPFSLKVLKAKLKNFFVLKQKLQMNFSKSTDMPPSDITYSVIDEEFLSKAIDVINENIEDPDFDNDALVDSLSYSRALVYKKVKCLTNQSLGDFIKSIRVKAAARLFHEGHTNITDVCYQVGFKQPNVLTRHFKKVYGIPPSIYIKKNTK